jgi:hypothetical protein
MRCFDTILKFHYVKDSKLDLDQFSSADIWVLDNKEGQTALSLLANYYRDHPHKFDEFIVKAVKQNVEEPFLLDMVRNLSQQSYTQLIELKILRE